MLISRYTSVWIMVIGIAPLVTFASDEKTSSDAAVTARVEAALRTNHAAAGIEVETSDGMVQLSGFVESEDIQERALETARTVKGVTSVRNDLVIRESKPTPGAVVDDTIIAAKVRKQLKANAANPGDDIQVDVDSGVVQLSGFVPSVEVKTRAADIASAVDGVRDVHNDIVLER